jgi:16S rRNA (guanine1207-N2)-methyltransferase
MTVVAAGGAGVETAPGVGLDAADRLILDEAAGILPGAGIVVVGSTALADAAHDRGAATVRVSDDTDVTTEQLQPQLFDNADVVLLRLPKSLAELDRVARAIASAAPGTVVVVAGGRLKYMTVGMNEVLQRSFAQLDVSLARQKSRVLIARVPKAVEPGGAERRYDAGLDLWVGAVGGVFAGTSIDIGTRALAGTFGRLPDYETAIDFGCGTGILAALLKRRRPAARVLAVDISAAAVESARETARANHLDIEVTRDDLLGSQPDASADLIVLNPPFHDGGALSNDTALAMFAEAGRVLKPGGQLWTVWNSHLGYVGSLVRTVGPTTQITRNAKFTVTASTPSSNRPSPTGSANN